MDSRVKNNRYKGNKTRETREHPHSRTINTGKIWFWRVVALLCIIVSWVIVLTPIPTRSLSNSFPTPNISQNEMLLDKLNLSNVSVHCPDFYTFSSIDQRCSTVCGYQEHYPLVLTIIKRVLLIILAMFNTGISILAIYRLVKYYAKYKFQHHPIFVGVFVNLLQSIVIGVPDILGANLFFCEGKHIDYSTLNANPTIQLHIQGALVTILSISNRLWFVMALVLMLPTIYTFSGVMNSKRNRIIIVIIEIVVCLVYPLVCGLASFIPFSGYRLSDSVLLPVSANTIVGTVFGYIPQLVISGVTITTIVLIVYRLHSQLQIGSSITGKRLGLQPIEKRLIIFSIIYFILIAIIALTLVVTTSLNGIIDNKSNEYSSYITLTSTYSLPNSTQTNSTLSLLPPADQQLFQESGYFFIISINDLSIRGMFIFVSSVLNFSFPKRACCQKRVPKHQPEHATRKGSTSIFINA